VWEGTCRYNITELHIQLLLEPVSAEVRSQRLRKSLRGTGDDGHGHFGAVIDGE
jgi:hypothetical protein